MQQMDEMIDRDDTLNPWVKLANAIVIQACKDYLRGKIKFGEFKNFCLGEWIQILSDVDGKYLLERLVLDCDRKRLTGGN